MKPQIFIFMGRSGSGKGTQSQLLIDYLKKHDPGHGVLYVQSGQELRELIKGETLTQKEMKKIYDHGDLAPEFLAVYVWAKALVERYDGNQHIVFDGTPRKIHEAGVLDSFFEMYNFAKHWVLEIDIDSDESIRRLLARKRMDDTEEEIRERLSWYKAEVTPTFEYFHNNPRYSALRIDGERPIEDIHREIVQKLGLE